MSGGAQIGISSATGEISRGWSSQLERHLVLLDDAPVYASDDERDALMFAAELSARIKRLPPPLPPYTTPSEAGLLDHRRRQRELKQRRRTITGTIT
jgi:hypothetical protein